jgi:formylglycine-generating enzyme required for sulfatase activity
MTGKEYRLPSEAEWEYACRARTTTPFAFGPSLSSAQANFDGKVPYGAAPKGVYLEETTPVGGYSPNAFGIYDMHGNVWEWVEDVHHDSYKGAPIDGSAWVTGGDPEWRIRRGGSWFNYGMLCRSASKDLHRPEWSSNDLGFRVAISAK